MKKHFLLFILVIIAVAGFSQPGPSQPPYKRFPNFPPVKLLLPDNTYFTKDALKKKSVVMLMIFNPQCDHCQHETEDLIKHINEFRNIQIIMATVMPFDSMMYFRKKYKLAQYSNIVVGQDIHFFLPSFYMISNLPYLAFYNKKKELISVFEGSMPMSRVVEIFKKED